MDKAQPDKAKKKIPEVKSMAGTFRRISKVSNMPKQADAKKYLTVYRSS
jgi:hypothetical protein